MGEKEAQLLVLTSSSPALVHGWRRSQRKELPQMLSLNHCSTSHTRMTWRSRGRRMTPFETTWTLSLKVIGFKRERVRGSSISPSDPFLPKKNPQSSFCTGSCTTNLACLSMLCQGSIYLVLLLPFMEPLCLEIVSVFHQKIQPAISMLMWHFRKWYDERERERERKREREREREKEREKKREEER